jgi:hypothetical protein
MASRKASSSEICSRFVARLEDPGVAHHGVEVAELVDRGAHDGLAALRADHRLV